MMNKILFKPDSSARFLGRRHKIEIWSALLSYNVEPPEPFYATEIQRQIVLETGSKISPADVSNELEDLETEGLLEEVEVPESPSPKNYRCIPASPGWLMVNGTVEAFTAMYSDAVSRESRDQ